ncbi:MAG: chemotaxis protein CheA [Planctomycetota bacterium]
MTQHENLDLVADYLGEAHDYLDGLNRILLELADGDGTWAADKVNELFRSAHSLKGLSACFGFERSNAVTHELEGLLVLVRDGKRVPDTRVVRALFDAIDLVQHLTSEIAATGHEHAEVQLVIDHLKVAATAAPEDPAVGGAASPQQARARTAAAAGGEAAGKEANETVRVRMDRLDRMVNLTGELVITRSRFRLVAQKLRSMHRLCEMAAAVTELGHDLAAIDRVDFAATPADELRAMCARVRAEADQLAQGFAEVVQASRSLRELETAANDLDTVVGSIHEAVLQLRMVPLDTVFRRLQRTVRDTAEAVGKQVDLEMDGGDTQIDKRIADELVNPLVHILRNAVDHGLEPNAGRLEAGKPPRGKVRVGSRQQGSSVVIEVTDDGRGIDPARVLAKAVEKGLITAEAAATMSPDDARRLILMPGFSTATVVTEVSGRGMGMDIVESSIKRLRGSLELESTLGKGTTFRISLPPSMSILSSLLLHVRGTMFALPMTEVREIVELARHERHSVQQRPTIIVREQPIPLVTLPATYAFPSTMAEAENDPAHAIVFGNGSSCIALAVESVVGKEDLVVKPLCTELTEVEGLAGMALRGDGSVTLILDPTSFSDLALRRIAAAAPALACPAAR